MKLFESPAFTGLTERKQPFRAATSCPTSQQHTLPVQLRILG